MNVKFERSKNDFLTLLKLNNYRALGEYLGASKKVKILCPDNHEWEVTPSHFKNGVRCPCCRGLSKSQAKIKFFKMVESEDYKCFSDYLNNKTKVELQCPNGHIYNVRPNDFMTGHRCRSCSISNSDEIMQRKIKSSNELNLIAKKRGFKILGEYINLNNKIKMSCPNGHIRMYDIGHFKNGFGCAICNGTDTEHSKQNLIKLSKSENYEVVGEYVNVMTKIEFKCPKGHMFKIRPNDFKNGYRCPICNSSSYGEDIAFNFLHEKGIFFEAEKTFEDLIGLGGGNLRFDIYIPNMNVAIEIQGEQHFEYDDFLTHNVFEHDEIKRDYCKKNNIKLFEIKYFSKALGINKAKENVINDLKYILNSVYGEPDELQRN